MHPSLLTRHLKILDHCALSLWIHHLAILSLLIYDVTRDISPMKGKDIHRSVHRLPFEYRRRQVTSLGEQSGHPILSQSHCTIELYKTV